MELKAYLRVLRQKWRIVLLTFVVTYGATLVLTLIQLPVYESSATFVVRLSPSFRDERSTTASLDTLSRQSEIATTYSMLATSQQIKRQAADEIGLTPEQRSATSVSSQLIAGTNILEITVAGPNPEIVRDFTNAIGTHTIAYVQRLYQTFELEPLDQANVANAPIRPNKWLNLTLGAVAGLVVGAGLAFLSAYLQAPLENLSNFNVLDADIGVYNKRYFMLRLRQEVSRAKRNNYPLCMALIDVDHERVLEDVALQLRHETLRKVVLLLKPSLREEDLIARLNGSILAFLYPDTIAETARETVERLQANIAMTPLELEQSGVIVSLRSIAGVAAYQGTTMEPEEILAKAQQALAEASTATQGDVSIFAANGAGEWKVAFGKSA